MNRHKTHSKEMVSMKNKNKISVSCSTPEHQADSPSRDSDSMYDSDAGSPVPFLCTQDGAEGETDVVWNFYTPKSEHAAKSRFKNSTPVSRRSKRTIKPKLIEKQLPKRRAVKLPQKKTELFQELIELNQNLHELINCKKSETNCTEKINSGSEDDIFNESQDFSPKSRLRSNSRCLRRNVLSSNFVKPDPEAALESDDSMNECLIKASQVVEENIRNESVAKRPCHESKFNNKTLTSDFNFKMDQDSMDAILNSIKLESPVVNSVKKYDSPKLNNDSFDSLVGNLNDSTLDRLTQMPIKVDTSKAKHKLNSSKDGNSWTIKELVMHDSPSKRSIFSRHSSMPESPTIINVNKPSTSGMAFGRYNSMPFSKDVEQVTEPGDSPIRCTPEEIKKKHQLAREKLMAKRLLPFTSSQKTIQPLQKTVLPSQKSALPTQKSILPSQKSILPSLSTQISQPLVVSKISEAPTAPKKTDIVAAKKFQPRTAMVVNTVQNKSVENPQKQTSASDIKSIIERKRQEALMKLRRRQIPNKMV